VHCGDTIETRAGSRHAQGRNANTRLTVEKPAQKRGALHAVGVWFLGVLDSLRLAQHENSFAHNC
jgi:hypothetical protein